MNITPAGCSLLKYGQISPSTPTCDKAAIVNRLFENHKPTSEDFLPCPEILHRIWTHPERDHQAKAQLTNALAEQFSLEESILALIPEDPLSAALILAVLESQDAFSGVVKALMSEGKRNHYQQVISLMNALATCFCPEWEKGKLLDSFFYVFDEEQFQDIVEAAVKHLDATDIARLFTLTNDKPTASAIVEHVGSTYFANPRRAAAALRFIEGIAACAEAHFHGKPRLLTMLLTHENEEGFPLSDFLVPHLDSLSSSARGYFLWCLPQEELNKHWENFDPAEQTEALLADIDAVFKLEQSPQAKAQIVSSLLLPMDEESLFAFLPLLLIAGSPALPYVLCSLSDSAFEVFATVLDAGTRSAILRQSLSKNIKENCFIYRQLQRTPWKSDCLCNVAVLDIVSQDIISVAAESFGKMMTMGDVFNYLRDGVSCDDLSEKMTKFQGDFQRVPPVLLGLSMKNQEWRPILIAALRYFADDQLIACAQAIPKGEENEILDQMISFVSVDQLKTILRSLSTDVVISFITAKAEEMGALQKKLEAREQTILAHLFELDDSATAIERKQNLVTLTDQLLLHQASDARTLTSYVNEILSEMSRDIALEFNLEVPEGFHRLEELVGAGKKYAARLQGKQGLFAHLESLSPSKNTPLPHPHASPSLYAALTQEFLEQIGVPSKEALQGVGLSGDKDLQHLGCSLAPQGHPTLESALRIKRYLTQSQHLAGIWIFLKQKHLPALDDLVSSFLIQEPEDLFQLENIAAKMGWNP